MEAIRQIALVGKDDGLPGNAERNKILDDDRPAHDWYRFVLSFPPHLVRDYIKRFSVDRTQRVLDPFCGTGTTIVESKKLGVQSVGIEAHPMSAFASRVKVDWSPDPEGLQKHARNVANEARRRLMSAGISDDPVQYSLEPVHEDLRILPAESAALLLGGSISPVPLHKTLILLDCIREMQDVTYHDHEILALAKALVTSVGNLHFGPEVGVTKPKDDALVVAAWLAEVERMSADLKELRCNCGIHADVKCADSRLIGQIVEPASVDAVITSPPYPNEKDYTRTTRLESVILGFITSKAQLRKVKEGLVRSNTRNVYKGDDDDIWVAGHPEIVPSGDHPDRTDPC